MGLLLEALLTVPVVKQGILARRILVGNLDQGSGDIARGFTAKIPPSSHLQAANFFAPAE